MSDDAASTTDTIRAWLDQGLGMAAQVRALDWSLADWMEDGKRSGHLSRIKWPLLSESVGIAPKRLKDLLKAATTFPPAERTTALSVEHHAAVANLPRDEALALLARSANERLPAKAMREAATQHRYNTGQNFQDEDADSTLCTLVLRAWNRATPDARDMAFEQLRIAAAKGHAIVDEDEAPDARR